MLRIGPFTFGVAGRGFLTFDDGHALLARIHLLAHVANHFEGDGGAGGVGGALTVVWNSGS